MMSFEVLGYRSTQIWSLFFLFMFDYDRIIRIFNLYKLFLYVIQVVAHFGASWCVMSQFMNYKFEELAQTHPEVLFLYVDVDDVQVNTIYIMSRLYIFYYVLRSPSAAQHAKQRPLRALLTGSRNHPPSPSGLRFQPGSVA
jgi:hypothetical protein